MTADVTTVLAQSPVFGRLPASARAELARVARRFECKGRTVLHSARLPATYIFHVIKGRIELTSVSAEGGESAVGSFGPGQWATWLAPFDGRPTERDMHAVDRSVVIAIPTADVRNAFDQHPEVYPYLLREIATRFRAVLRMQDARTVMDRDQRVAQILLMLASSDDQAPEPVIAISRAALAIRAGCSRQTLYEVLGRLEQQKLIRTAYRSITILQKQKLAALCSL